ncbi:hypothetical protein NLI96_g7450 [Meripilus lineatus]|uniref:Chitin synthase n=1 Tax=Meripilus lineatus TaxID=2056292 RepID=A0AAD5V4D2_9APHY|nr:hypothetical protein NLI96_g7450 [Physisporinus lineatus]
MGCYQEGVAQESVAGEKVVAHIFESTSQVLVTEYGEVVQGPCPVQMIFCLKEENKKKLNSHRWFFNAFCPLLQPNSFYQHPSVGGACGEICVDVGKTSSLLLTNPLVAAQNFEYKTSNILDKPLESVCGFISVLPGAFSAYRYQALLDGPEGDGPLTTYLMGENLLHGLSDDGGLFERNRYLAEDRVLSFEIVTKKHEAWVLRYVKSARATTDAPTSVPEFISQRRRWLNGALFAAINATIFFTRIWSSGHSLSRKIILQIEFTYNALQLFFTWISLANYFLGFFYLISTATSSPTDDAFSFIFIGAGDIVFEAFVKLYFAILFVILVCSLGNRPQGSKWLYSASMIMFGSTPHSWEGWRDYPHLARTNKKFRDLVLSLFGTLGAFVISAVLYLDPWHIITSFLQYMVLLPSYVNILMMYAMCNVHDVTWGTKGDNNASKALGSARRVTDALGRDMVEVELPTSLEDVDHLWDASFNALAFKPPPEKEDRDPVTRQADEDRNSRTNLILAWFGTNIVIILIFTSNAFLDYVEDNVQATGDAGSNPYLKFLFYSMYVSNFTGVSFGDLILYYPSRISVSFIRFTGSMAYLVLEILGI